MLNPIAGYHVNSTPICSSCQPVLGKENIMKLQMQAIPTHIYWKFTTYPDKLSSVGRKFLNATDVRFQ